MPYHYSDRPQGIKASAEICRSVKVESRQIISGQPCFPASNGGRVTLPSSLIRENFMESQSSPSQVNHFSISLFTSSLTSVFFHFHYLGHVHIHCLWMLIVISVHSVFHIISFHARSQSMQLSWSWIVCACFFMLILRPQAENKCFKFKPFGCHSFMCTHTHMDTRRFVTQSPYSHSRNCDVAENRGH